MCGRAPCGFLFVCFTKRGILLGTVFCSLIFSFESRAWPSFQAVPVWLPPPSLYLPTVHELGCPSQDRGYKSTQGAVVQM